MKGRVAYLGLFVSLAFIFSYVETLIPLNIGIAGVKLGVANMVIIVTLYILPLRDVYMISVVRSVLTGLTFGNPVTMLYSLAGGLFSLTVMSLLKRKKKWSVTGISLWGGVCHNIGQLIMAMVLMDSLNVVFYLPVLLICGAFTGLVIGLVSGAVLKRVHVLYRIGDGDDSLSERKT